MDILEEMYGEDWDPGVIMALDDGGRKTREALDALRGRRAQLKSRLDRGVSPDEFKKGEALLTSYDAAIGGLEQAWEHRQRR